MTRGGPNETDRIASGHSSDGRTSHALLAAFAIIALLTGVGAARAIDRKAKAIAEEKPPVLSLRDALMHDAASPVIGNPEGDVTIVAFVDYNSPDCRKSETQLEALVAADPKVRVIFKDLPMLGDTSGRAAEIAIAASWQGKYLDMHRALIRIDASPATDKDIEKAIIASGVDRARLDKDVDKRVADIITLLNRNIAEAHELKLEGTPVYLVGPFVSAGPLDLGQFKKLVADARDDQAKTAPKN